MNCRFPIVQRTRTGKPVRVPCGKCLCCQVNTRSEWTLRLIHEHAFHKYATFLTLTYDDDHLPSNNSLSKRDLQNFMKRLRINFSRAGLSNKFVYYAAGEYGDKTFRPHYHLIIFGLNPRDEAHKRLVFKSWPNCKWNKLNDSKTFGLVNKDSIGYVTGYVHKKLYGDLKKEVYTDNGLEAPFALQSAGIGKRYFLKNRSRLARFGYCILDGRKVPIPRYYKLLDYEYGNQNYIWNKRNKAVNKMNLDVALKLHSNRVLAYTTLYTRSPRVHRWYHSPPLRKGRYRCNLHSARSPYRANDNHTSLSRPRWYYDLLRRSRFLHSVNKILSPRDEIRLADKQFWDLRSKSFARDKI